MSKNFFSQVYRRIRIPLVLFLDKISGRRLPRIVVLVVNNACNLRCKYCFGEYNKRSSSSDFTTEELKQLIDDLYANGTIYLTVHGGETLLRKDIGEIVRYMKGKGMYVNLITNGLLLKQKLDEIKDVDSICISLDGKEDNNDAVRGKGSFKAAMSAIDMIKSAGISLRVQATLTKYTKNDIGYLAALAQEKKFHLEFSLLFQSTPNIRELMLNEDETREVLREIIELKKKGYPIFTSIRTLELALNWPYSYEQTTLSIEELPKNLKPIPCGYSIHKFTIDADGRSFPCFPLNKEFNALNVKEVGVKKAFEHVVKSNTCVLCPFLTQNDWNFMMTLSPSFLYEQVKLHLKEILKRY